MHRDRFSRRSTVWSIRSSLEGGSLQNLGLLLLRQGKMEEAEPAYREAIARLRR